MFHCFILEIGFSYLREIHATFTENISVGKSFGDDIRLGDCQHDKVGLAYDGEMHEMVATDDTAVWISTCMKL